MTDPADRPGPVGSFLRGLSTSVTGNAQAFGFSITVTMTFGVVDLAEGHPSRLQLLGFAMAAVAAFSVLNLVVFLFVRRTGDLATQQRALLIGTATDFLAVAAAIGSAFGVTALLHGWWAWLLAPFLAGLVYVLVQSVELAIGRDRADDDEDDADGSDDDDDANDDDKDDDNKDDD